MPPASEGWRRLHPLSPFLRAGRLGLVGIYIVLDAANEDIAENAGELVAVALLTGLAFALAMGVYGYVAWRITGYRLDGQELRVRTGVVFRSHRHVPLARLESVDVARPLVARIFGLADVRVEVASRGGTEVHLRYLSEPEAWALRERLTDARRLLRGGPPETPVLRPLLEVPSRELVLGYAVAPAALVAVVAVLVMAVTAVADRQGAPAVALIVAVTMPLVLITVAVRFDRLYRFRLAEDDDGLHIQRGLVNQLSQKVAVGRLQSIRIEEPALWRPFGRARLIADVAGYRGGERERAAESAVLLPIAPMTVVHYLAAQLPTAFPAGEVEFSPAPRAARWRAPLRWRYYGVGWTPVHAVVRSGILRRRTDIVPYAKLQSLRLVQGPWQRRLALASLHLDTAGSRVAARAAHRGTKEAVDLARRSRQADAAGRPAPVGHDDLPGSTCWDHRAPARGRGGT